MKFDLASIYSEYPRKLGKTKGIAKLEKTIKTEQDFQDLKKALKHYNEQVVRESTEKQYIKHFSTWANCWRDYVEVEEVEVDLSRLPRKAKEKLLTEMLQNFKLGTYDA